MWRVKNSSDRSRRIPSHGLIKISGTYHNETLDTVIQMLPGSMVCLYGGVGVGKSQLALNAAELLGYESHVISCSGVERVQVAVEEAGCLAFDDRCCLIFDDADNISLSDWEDALKTTSSHVIIIAHSKPAKTRGVLVVEVKPFTIEEVATIVGSTFPDFNIKELRKYYSSDLRRVLNGIASGIPQIRPEQSPELNSLEVAYKAILKTLNIDDFRGKWQWAFHTLTAVAPKLWKGDSLKEALSLLSVINLPYPDPTYLKEALMSLPITRARPSLFFVKRAKQPVQQSPSENVSNFTKSRNLAPKQKVIVKNQTLDHLMIL